MLFLLYITLFSVWIALLVKDRKGAIEEESVLTPQAKTVSPSDLEISQEKNENCEFTYSIKDYFQIEPSPSDDIQKIIGYQNNKFGLYIYSTENFIKKADELVNSNGGDWGYVLIPYNVKDYDESKWMRVFNLLNSKHLIPIIQLWDVSPDSYEKETKKAVEFLDSFPWPVKNKYISIYNEPNDARFWKDNLDPRGYAKILDFTIDEFKKKSKEFFMLNGAFNSTAPTSEGYMEEREFMREMNASVPGVFGKLDGWASHPYPQPGFVGLPTDTGRGSIRA